MGEPFSNRWLTWATQIHDRAFGFGESFGRGCSRCRWSPFLSLQSKYTRCSCCVTNVTRTNAVWRRSSCRYNIRVYESEIKNVRQNLWGLLPIADVQKIWTALGTNGRRATQFVKIIIFNKEFSNALKYDFCNRILCFLKTNHTHFEPFFLCEMKDACCET